jgi:hypothetical protein
MEDYNDQSVNPDITNFFIKHVVAVAIRLEIGSTNQEPFITATVLQASNRWFLLTSAHWFDDIERLINSGYKISSIRLVDSLSNQAEFKMAIPFSVSNFHPIMLDSYDDEIDIAIIPLSPLYIDLLKRNDIQALDESMWKELPSQFDACWMFGLPAEIQISDNSHYSLTPLGLQVFLDEDCFRVPKGKKYPRLFGKVETRGIIQSLGGMSGGPILIYSNNKYWLIALQTRWNQDSRVIEAIPIKYLGGAINKYYENS